MQHKNCLFCGKVNPLTTKKPRKYCSKKCLNKGWKVQNPKKNKESGQKYREKNREKIKKRNREYLKKQWSDPDFRERRRLICLKSTRKRTKALRSLIFEKYGLKCAECSYSDIRALQIDHINGGGNVEVRKLKRPLYYEKVLQDKKGLYQILCANCNWIKRFENPKEKSGPKVFYT